MDIKAERKQKNQNRHCVLTGETKLKEDLIRFVVGPNDEVTPDIKASLPGRGVWLCAQKATIEEAVKRKSFHRGFAKSVEVGPEIAQQVDDLLKKAALGQLKMANKAGNVVYGFTKLMAALEKETIIAIIHAQEASKPEAGKLDYRFRTNLEQSGVSAQNFCKKPFNGFKTQELSLAFGAANVIHAGLKDDGAAKAAIKAMTRYTAYNNE